MSPNSNTQDNNGSAEDTTFKFYSGVAGLIILFTLVLMYKFRRRAFIQKYRLHLLAQKRGPTFYEVLSGTPKGIVRAKPASRVSQFSSLTEQPPVSYAVEVPVSEIHKLQNSFPVAEPFSRSSDNHDHNHSPVDLDEDIDEGDVPLARPVSTKRFTITLT